MMLRSLIRVRKVGSFVYNNQINSISVNKYCQRTITTNCNSNFAKAATDENVPASAVKRNKNPFADQTTENKLELPPLNIEKQKQKQIVIDDETTSATEEIKAGEKSPPLDAAERERRLKVLQLEVDIAYQEGKRVPQLDFFRDDHWAYLLSLPTRSARMRYYGFLWQLERKKESKERKKAERAIGVQERIEAKKREREENKHILYGLSDTSMFLRIYDSAINQWMNNRLTRAMQFAPKIVLDCSYDEHMNRQEANNAAKQLMLCFADNRAHDEPFDLHYCNAKLHGQCMQCLKRFIPTMLNPEFPMNVHEKCFTEIFPHERLVYLTPHCRNDLEAYNPDDIYIIGAMVDKANNEPLSLAKAKRLNLRMARLPLDRYLQWGSGSGKSLTLDQMIKIMLDIKRNGNWEQALKHVPRRKIVDYQRAAMQHREKLEKRADRLNVRVDGLFDYDSRPRKSHSVRVHKDNLKFNLDTWASKKKTRNS